MKAVTFPDATTRSAEPMVEHEIRLRAYEIFEERGGTEGRALEDWLQAEAEVQRRSQRI